MKKPICERVHNRYKLAARWVSQWLPMFRRTHRELMEMQVAGHASYCRELKKLRDAEIERRTEAVNNILDRVGRINWHRSANTAYRMTIMFDPTAMMGWHTYPYGGREELKIIAREMARRVEHEIRTSKFVETAERNWLEERRPYSPSFREDTHVG